MPCAVGLPHEAAELRGLIVRVEGGKRGRELFLAIFFRSPHLFSKAAQNTEHSAVLDKKLQSPNELRTTLAHDRPELIFQHLHEPIAVSRTQFLKQRARLANLPSERVCKHAVLR